MTTKIKKISSLLLIGLLFINLFPTTIVKADNVLKDGGEYKIQVNFFKDNTGNRTKESSAANGYIQQEATIKVENGQPYLYVTLKNSNWWKNFATSKSGEHPVAPSPVENYQGTYQDVEYSTPNNGERVAKIKINSIDNVVYSYMHIKVEGIPGFDYDNWYQVDLTMNPSSLTVVSEPSKPVEPEPPVTTEPPTNPAESTDPTTPKPLADGLYTIPFTAKHATQDKASSMQGYFDNPAWLKVENGHNFVALRINKSETVTSLQTTLGSSLTDATVLSTDEGSNSRIVQFEVSDLNQELLSHVTYQAPMGNGTIYQGKADFRFIFDGTKAIPTSEYPTATPKKLTDGLYTIPFTAKHATQDKASSMQGYFDNPAWLKVENGHNFVAVRINKSETVTSLQTTLGTGLANATVLSTDEKTNSRIVQFEVTDLNQELASHVTYQAPMGNGTIYQGKADFRFSFETAAAKSATEYPTAEKPIEKPDPTPTPDPIPDPTPEKPAETKKLTNGHQYSIQFQVNQENSSEKSMMDGYLLKPGIIKVENNQPYLYLTMKDSDWIKTFDHLENGVWQAAELVKTDSVANTRTVKYKISDETAETQVKTHVKIENVQGFEYDHDYLVSVKLDQSTLQDVTGQEIIPTQITPTPAIPNASLVDSALANQTAAKLGKPDFSTDGTVKTLAKKQENQTQNPKTMDTASIGLYGTLFTIATFYFLRRYQAAKK